jgi:FAD/FMN-containing dehydrogenase
VIGMKVVLADGSVIKAGGRVVKNVAGYDLCKLFTGSFGTLGIITELNFKLRPRPAREATIIATGSIAELIAGARRVLDARLFPVAAELVSPAFANRLGIQTQNAALLVRFAGNEKGVAYQLEQTLLNLKQLISTEVPSGDALLWQTLASVPLEHRQSSRTRVLPSELSKFVTQFSADSLWQAGVADGRILIMNCAHTQQSPDPLSQRVKQQLDPFNLVRGHDHEPAA